MGSPESQTHSSGCLLDSYQVFQSPLKLHIPPGNLFSSNLKPAPAPASKNAPPSTHLLHPKAWGHPSPLFLCRAPHASKHISFLFSSQHCWNLSLLFISLVPLLVCKLLSPHHKKLRNPAPSPAAFCLSLQARIISPELGSDTNTALLKSLPGILITIQAFKSPMFPDPHLTSHVIFFFTLPSCPVQEQD